MPVTIRNDFDSLIQGLQVQKSDARSSINLSPSLSLYPCPAITTDRDKKFCQMSHMLMDFDSMGGIYCTRSYQGYIRWMPSFPTLQLSQRRNKSRAQRRKLLMSKVPEAVTFVPDIMGGPTSAKPTSMDWLKGKSIGKHGFYH